MAEKKELDAKTQDPQYKNQLTQNYMLDYVLARGTKKDQIWYYKLVLDSKKPIKRGDKEFVVLDVQSVRKAFAEKFFPDLGKAKPKKVNYFDKIEALLKEAEGKK